MASFSKTSLKRLSTCTFSLQRIMQKVIKRMDCTVVEGVRTPERQLELYNEGKSQLDGVNKLSKHQPNSNGFSEAIDIVPYVNGVGVVWDDDALWDKLAIEMFKAAMEVGVQIEWGGHWNNFVDKPHFQVNN